LTKGLAPPSVHRQYRTLRRYWNDHEPAHFHAI
jgi:hypothetical protein